MQKTIRRDTKPSDNMRVKKDEEKVEATKSKPNFNKPIPKELQKLHPSKTMC